MIRGNWSDRSSDSDAQNKDQLCTFLVLVNLDFRAIKRVFFVLCQLVCPFCALTLLVGDWKDIWPGL